MMEREFSMYETALCHVQGELFTLAWDKGYVMRDFIPAFMHSESAARVDSPYSQLQWCGEEYLLSGWNFAGENLSANNALLSALQRICRTSRHKTGRDI